MFFDVCLCCLASYKDLIIMWGFFFGFHLDPGVRSGFPCLYRHWDSLHCPDAYNSFLRGLLSMLWQLWWEDAAEADILHPLSQKNSLLQLIFNHNHYLVSMYVSLCLFLRHGRSSFKCVQLTAWVHLLGKPFLSKFNCLVSLDSLLQSRQCVHVQKQ